MGPDVAPLLEGNFPSFAAHDFSPLGMFMAADFVVKAVMVLLILASIVSWTIAFAKIVEITLAKRKARRALHSAQQAQTLACLVDQLQNQTGASVLFLQETLREISLSTQQDVSLSAQQGFISSMQQGVAGQKGVALSTMQQGFSVQKGVPLSTMQQGVSVQKGVPLSTTQQSAAGSEEAENNNNPDILSGMLHEGVKERVHSLLSRSLLVATQRMAAGNAILATIGAISPFVGLFATVWGIMNSFIGIAKTQTTRLDVVAPGIAEALLATALGLFVAIPAVVMYNGLSRALSHYRSDLGNVAAAIERLLSRDMDRQRQQKSLQ
ncbi:MotA/TolQ/ExbB proton channel family protein [Bartonella bacilliformis]|uniref:TonB-system energizer ExbB n=2 Tax=Bartonella bacilliformis TaxID=774 RepID=A0ABP2SPK0_BARBA|nr:MotA/TolQ/ExbB proton channel family protein [Bartonella bacilliformis]ABM45170.1 putative tonB-system energizer ExbB [Bartonella bacilliformis KC583]AMG85390.1 biopolymer transporter ExbB [Bartonella bacilliformis]EKS46062.1 putative tonB-system energizer ExbB [Bartonella bacilliformis INS]EYS89173.1 hypothetical protein X472_00792 [Bartonella bacilliformis San Pedro600-02]EYS94120.1 hypothetical protein X470_01153 [Bartonella bacilliformis Peru-18]